MPSITVKTHRKYQFGKGQLVLVFGMTHFPQLARVKKSVGGDCQVYFGATSEWQQISKEFLMPIDGDWQFKIPELYGAISDGELSKGDWAAFHHGTFGCSVVQVGAKVRGKSTKRHVKDNSGDRIVDEANLSKIRNIESVVWKK